MNINRNNYEEYFLLYADNELSAQEKNMVEIFVEQNADLEEEFTMLKQSVLKPDHSIILNDKSSLFKGGDEFVNLNNYEEKFLLYADNELNLSEVEETKKFVLSNSSLQNEFTLLQTVKYEPDTSIVFPDKSSLYKKDNDDKVIPFRWKALAAAIVLGLGLWTGISYIQNNKTIQVTINDHVAKITSPKPSVQPKHEVVITQERVSTPSQQIVQKPSVISEKKQPQPQQNVTVKNINSVEKTPEVINKNKDLNNAIIAGNDPVKSTTNFPNENTAEPNSKTVTQNTAAPPNNYAQTTSYIAEAEEKSENYVFYNITQEEFKKSKLGILFKKVKRTIERKNPLRERTFKVSSIQEIPNN
jgi:hypothetical protein